MLSLTSLLACLAGLWQRPCCVPRPAPQPLQHQAHRHALAAFEQGDWLEELELLQLGQALQRSARQRGGYDGETFDVMITIADVLEADHGWPLEQSEAWLARMGVWEAEL